jgi:hypothetical protein
LIERYRAVEEAERKSRQRKDPTRRDYELHISPAQPARRPDRRLIVLHDHRIEAAAEQITIQNEALARTNHYPSRRN